MSDLILVPVPKKLKILPGTYRFTDSLVSEIERYTLEKPYPAEVRVRESSSASKYKEGYVLTISENGIIIAAGERTGIFHAFGTLKQLLRQTDISGKLRCLRIEDSPDFPVRGVSLDISRDRVPTMETLKSYIDLIADLKYNQLQLYTEHTFAYSKHKKVWENASPVYPEEMREIDSYCAVRGIELVPNQNSFGHLERWLQHPEYKHLAEAPDGCIDFWGIFRPVPSTLDPNNGEVLSFLSGLYDELLPCFKSPLFNIGGDEPFGLGQGKSRQKCEEVGRGRVYLDFLLELHKLVVQKNKIMQFWGDIILQHPELIPELPKDSIAMDWGYEADHPFTEECRLFADSGLKFYVCPGTSSWNSLGGRWNNARENLLNAARSGIANGARGYLVMDWGDNGHWQQYPIALPGLIYGAAVSWSIDTGESLDVSECLSRHVFFDSTGKAAMALMQLGNVYDDGIVRLHNAGILYLLMQDYFHPGYRKFYLKYKEYKFSRERELVEQAKVLIGQSDIKANNHDLLEKELFFTCDIMLHAAKLAGAFCQTKNFSVKEIEKSRRRELSANLEKLILRYKELWLQRSRRGGLADSSGRFKPLLSLYNS